MSGPGETFFAIVRVLLFPFFFCVPKRRNKKKAPQPVLALRASLTSRRRRDAKKLGLRPQTVLASFPAPVCEARQDKWGRGARLPLARSRAPERLPKRGFALFEAKPSLQSPGSIEEHRASRPWRDKGHGCPFLVSSFGHAKEEKGTKKRAAGVSPAAQSIHCISIIISQPPSTAQYPRCQWFPSPANPWPWPPRLPDSR